MHADDLGEGLLAQAALLTVAAQAAPYGPLEVAFHDGLDAARLLLVGLQTYE
ncbi:hypothetical protein GCM10023225_00090 [Kineococcus glutinatus]|uniref:Uncharacterized protein n=1 Tax=Kineococcus glutinatus TaxID=1070872 RepID=A0ABP9H6F3_9ACTN